MCLSSPFVCLVLAVGVHGSVFSGRGVFPLCGVALWWYDSGVLEIGYCGVVLWYPLWKNFSELVCKERKLRYVRAQVFSVSR